MRNTYDGDGIVEKAFSENDDVEYLVDVYLLKNGQDGYRIDGTDQCREKKHVEERCLAAEDIEFPNDP